MMQNNISYDGLISSVAGVQDGQQNSLVGEFLSEKRISIKELKRECENKKESPSNYKIELPSFRKIMLRKMSELYENQIDKIAFDIGVIDPDVCISLIVSSDRIRKYKCGILYITRRDYDWCRSECAIYIVFTGESKIFVQFDTPHIVAQELSDDDVKITDIGCMCE
jgi:hypothetical protein